MTSPPALIFDTYYHIYNRGINRGNIFFEERNYGYFLDLLYKHLEPVVDIYAYCLLKNHFHLLVKTKPEEEIIEYQKTQTNKLLRSDPGMDLPGKYFSNFFNAYAKSINKSYDRVGSLFQHPFGRMIISNDRQFWNVIAYIHQNPQKHRFVDDFREWKYSSYEAIISEIPTMLQKSAVLDWFGGTEQYLELHENWVSKAQSKWFVENDPE